MKQSFSSVSANGALSYMMPSDPQLGEADTSCLVTLIRNCAACFPDMIAAEFEGATLTYGELDDRANRLGSYLRELGVGSETLVGLLVDRSLDMIVGVLGIQRAGGAYVPIDPGYPAERVAFMLSDSGAPFIVTQESFRATLPSLSATVISLDGHRTEIEQASATAPFIAEGPERLAYIIYTSGSTGHPKGVQVEHRGVVNLIAGMREEIPIAPGDRHVALAPLAFDVSVADIFFPLSAGARVIIAPRETATNPVALMTLLRQSAATHMQATPSTWRMLLDAGWKGQKSLIAMCGGEALPQPVSDRLQGVGADVWNLYGPTETTIWATVSHIQHPGDPVSIGHAMRNVWVSVRDDHGNNVSVGETGELYIGGTGVARGYLNRPQLSAERFIDTPAEPWDHPESQITGHSSTHVYRTGDIVRVRPDLLLEYVGRTDHQVKLHGYRIELGEVEAALVQQRGVKAAAVVVRDAPNGESQLVAYVTITVSTSVTPRSIRQALLTTLPQYMVPDVLVVLDALPLTTNGKVDRKQLPDPAEMQSVSRTQDVPYVAPRTPLEAQLVAIWEDILGIHPIGVTDDFFDLGATSLMVARIFQRVRQEVSATLPLVPPFQTPTIEKFAALLTNHDSSKGWTSLVPVQPRGSRPPIFCVHGGTGTVVHFSPLANRLGDDQPFYGLQMQGVYGDAPPHITIEQMASHYIHEIKSVQSHGPYFIAGYCFGAIVAFEMVRQLEHRGESVPLVIAINGASPSYIKAYGPPRRLPPVSPPRAVPRSWAGRAILAVKRVKWALEWPKVRHRMKVQWILLRYRLTILKTHLYVFFRRPIPDVSRQAVYPYICHYVERRYQPGVFSGKMLQFVAPQLYRQIDLGWTPHVGSGMEIYQVPGEQETQRDAMHEPFVGFVAEQLRRTLAEYQV